MHEVECVLGLHHALLLESLFHSWANPKETLPCSMPRSSLCNEPVATAANGRAQWEQVCGPRWCWESAGHIWQVRVVLWCWHHPSAGHEGFSWCRSFNSSRRKQSSGIKELCAITHSLSELLPQYGRAPQCSWSEKWSLWKKKNPYQMLEPSAKRCRCHWEIYHGILIGKPSPAILLYCK